MAEPIENAIAKPTKLITTEANWGCDKSMALLIMMAIKWAKLSCVVCCFITSKRITFTHVKKFRNYASYAA